MRANVDRHVLDDAEDRDADLSNILRPLRASMSAMSCGVVTITAPVTGTLCASVSWMCQYRAAGPPIIVEFAPAYPEKLSCLRHHRAAPPSACRHR
jgi:hypothetical protein